MRKILFVLLVVLVGIKTVNAEENYYVNSYGVAFTKEEYEFFTEMYFDGYQEYMTHDDFNYFDKSEMHVNNVVTNYSYPTIIPMAESVTGTKKTLKISKVDSGSDPKIVVVAEWFQPPTTKSNDVIGARFVGTDLLELPGTNLLNKNGSKFYENIDRQNNGFGQTVLISGTNISLTQTYKVRKGGTVYASYQHAKQVISTVNSRKYTISADGYGGVFKLSGTAVSVYDNSQGVSMSV